MAALKPVSWLLAAVALGYGLWFAWAHAWVCDDAFISYRYVDHFVAGHGLVYNVGERVEGYTNFLWVMLLAAGRALGLDPISLSQVLGVACHLGTVGILAWVAARTRTLPVAAIALGIHAHAGYFASCGLETSMFVLLVTLGLVLLAFAERPVTFFACGLALILATLTRPDGAVVYACASVTVLGVAIRRRRLAPLAGFALPFVALYVPYFVWKYSYYGYPFPNTFYAKSASKPFLDQGLYYVGIYLATYWHLVLGLLAPLALLASPGLRRRRQEAVAADGAEEGRLVWVLASLVVPFLGYVVWVGGDFMFSRFCLAVTPALCLGVQLLARGRFAWIAVAVVVLGSFVNPYESFRSGPLAPANPRNVVEERDHYPGWYVEAYRILGQTLSKACEGVDLRIAIGGGQAMLGYFGEFSYVLEVNGLTDRFIAHREIEARGRIGHEKKLPLGHPYFYEKRIHMMVGAYQQLAIPGDRLAALRRFEFHATDVPFFPAGQRLTGFAQATLLFYDAPVMAALAGRPGLRFTPFPEHLDRYIAGLPGRPKAEVAADLEAFRAFYFDHNEDPGRLAQIEAYLTERP